MEWPPAVNWVTLLETFYLLTPPFILSCNPSRHSMFPLKNIVIMLQPFHTPSSGTFLRCIEVAVMICTALWKGGGKRLVYV